MSYTYGCLCLILSYRVCDFAAFPCWCCWPLSAASAHRSRSASTAPALPATTPAPSVPVFLATTALHANWSTSWTPPRCASNVHSTAASAAMGLTVPAATQASTWTTTSGATPVPMEQPPALCQASVCVSQVTIYPTWGTLTALLAQLGARSVPTLPHARHVSPAICPMACA